MNDEPKKEREPRRMWPWFVLVALLLGIALFAIWVWFAVQGVKRMKHPVLVGQISFCFQVKTSELWPGAPRK